jgi:cellulose biosynthesis protein BcsQ
MFGNSIALMSGKGGVGKTTLASNIAGILAAVGRKVLVVDLDHQADLGKDLGYAYSEEGLADGGSALLSAAISQVALDKPPLVGVRDNLDVIPSGGQTEALKKFIESYYPDGGAEAYEHHGAILGGALYDLVDNYDVVVFDCPPDFTSGLVYEALACTRWLLVPSAVDAASEEGLINAHLATQMVADRNPDLEMVGAVLFDLPSNANRLAQEFNDDIAAIVAHAGLREDLVFPTWVRTSKKSARDMRKYGKLAHEYYGEHGTLDRWVDGKFNPDLASGAAEALKDDFQFIVRELIERTGL